ncbi:MAG: heavy metal-binding domain-containing protein [Firmicutes bacterium]|nr:heavy metal-binding domain-containing protein [Bacillota bacterium]
MLVVTTAEIHGYEITETIGQVFGITVRSRGVLGNMGAGLKSIIGGEIKQYTKMLEGARAHAVERLVENAKAMGADAVVMMRFDSGEVAQSMQEVVAYGTAVKIARRA